LGDGEDSDAALRAAGSTGEVMPTASVGVGYGGVYDLDEIVGHGAGSCILTGMRFRETKLGKRVRFLLPSLKLKRRGEQGRTLEEDVHGFLVSEFGGYTASSGNLFGYWKDNSGKDSYGEHREFTVGLGSGDKLEGLKAFLGELAGKMGEECLYMEVAGEAMLIYGEESLGG
jgi:hypothetical protein